MGLFKKRNSVDFENTLSKRIGSYLNQWQRKLADYLNLKTRDVSNIAMLYWLIIFCAAFGSYLLYLITSAFGAFN